MSFRKQNKRITKADKKRWAFLLRMDNPEQCTDLEWANFERLYQDEEIVREWSLACAAYAIKARAASQELKDFATVTKRKGRAAFINAYLDFMNGVKVPEKAAA